MKAKKYIAIALSLVMLWTSVSAMAEEIPSSVKDFLQDNFNVEQEVLSEQNSVEYPYDFNPEATQKPYDSTPIHHEEIIEDDLVFDESIYRPIDENQMSLAAVNTLDPAWDAAFAEQFGDQYLKPYQAPTDKQSVSGNTGRLTIEETDLTLAGKNGLDVVIKRDGMIIKTTIILIRVQNIEWLEKMELKGLTIGM